MERRPLTGVFRRLPHSWIALVAGILSLYLTCESIYWIVAQPYPLGQVPLLVIQLVLLALLVVRPQPASIALIVVCVIADALPFVTPLADWPVLFFAVAVLGYHSAAGGVGASIGVAALSAIASAITGSGLATTRGFVSFAACTLLSAACGTALHWKQQRDQASAQLSLAKSNALVARRLHDSACNELADIIFIADQLADQGETGASGARQAALIRSTAEAGLQHVREAIVILERQEPATGRTTAVSPSDNSAEDLAKVIRTQRQVLASLGFEGSVIVAPGLMDGLAPDAKALIVDFTRELFGNIAKHALAADGYAVTMGRDEEWMRIDACDTARVSPVPGTGTGLTHYRETILALGGRWSVDSDGQMWSLNAQIPVVTPSCRRTTRTTTGRRSSAVEPARP